MLVDLLLAVVKFIIKLSLSPLLLVFLLGGGSLLASGDVTPAPMPLSPAPSHIQNPLCLAALLPELGMGRHQVASRLHSEGDMWGYSY